MSNAPAPRPPQRPRPAPTQQPAAPAEWAAETPVTPSPPPFDRPPRSLQRPTRRLFWAGFLTSFVLLSLVSCGGLVMSTGLNRLDLASLQGGEPAWSPPDVTPPPTPDPALSGAAAGTGDGLFVSGQTVRNITNSRVNIRQTPGHLGKGDNDILAQMQPGESVTIIGGPTPMDNLVWWQIQYSGNGRTIEGWTAEATGSGVQILGQ
ncbi:MAG: SH3 domain-containing protein [Caldilinea sp. CFX5]|nr:SH3 domain-containing protein [Caldilinea sp. CFX5]